MKRDNLHENPVVQIRRMVADAKRSADAAHTRPSGTTVLRENADIVWNNGTDTVSVRDLPASMQTVIETKLAEGLATEGRRNTVSTNDPPGDVTGYPDGAYWTKVPSASDMTVSAVWQLTDGSWVSQSIPDGGLVRSWADIGLLQVSTLAAKLITSGFFRTAESGKRIEIDGNGVRAYNDSGQNTVNINGINNLLTGAFRTAADGARLEIRSNVYSAADVGLYMYAGHNIPAALKVAVSESVWGAPGSVALTSSSGGGRYAELRMEAERVSLALKLSNQQEMGPKLFLDSTLPSILRGGQGLYLISDTSIEIQTLTLWHRDDTGISQLLAERNIVSPGGNNGSAATVARSDHLHDGRYAYATHSHPLPDIQCLRRSNIDYFINNGQAARINFDLGTLGSGMSWDVTNRQLVIDTAGLYEICFGVSSDTAAGTPDWYPRLQFNGTTLYTTRCAPKTGVMATKTFRCPAGSRISVEVANFTGAQMRVMNNADLTYLSAIYVGAI